MSFNIFSEVVGENVQVRALKALPFQIIYEVVGWENVILLVLRRVGSIWSLF